MCTSLDTSAFEYAGGAIKRIVVLEGRTRGICRDVPIAMCAQPSTPGYGVGLSETSHKSGVRRRCVYNIVNATPVSHHPDEGVILELTRPSPASSINHHASTTGQVSHADGQLDDLAGFHVDRI